MQIVSLTAVLVLASSVSSFADTTTGNVAKTDFIQIETSIENTSTPPIILDDLKKTISVGDFLKKMAGKYSGKGIAEIIGDKPDKILCKVENFYDMTVSELLLTGNCASVKGKKAVSGKITYNDGKLSGALISGANVETTKSFGTIVDGTLVLTTYALHNKTGELTKVRQEISHTEVGISTIFYRYSHKNREYKKIGSLDLKRL